jgi:glycine cleavage system H protein
MTRPTPPGAVASEGHPGGADAPPARPGPIAVSPAIGPLPAIYVAAAPGQASPAGLLWLAVAHAAGWAARWAARHPPIGGHMSDNPAGLRYSQDHLWARLDAGGRLVRSGVTNFAQQSLGDVVDVSPPRPGDAIQAGEPCGDIESVKSVSDLVAPVTGTVRTRNDALTSRPELVNTDPYGQGWMFETEVDPGTASQQLASLMDADAYHRLVGQ